MLDHRLTDVQGFPVQVVEALDILLHRVRASGGGVLDVKGLSLLLLLPEADTLRVLMECVRVGSVLLKLNGGLLEFSVDPNRPTEMTQGDLVRTFKSLVYGPR